MSRIVKIVIIGGALVAGVVLYPSKANQPGQVEEPGTEQATEVSAAETPRTWSADLAESEFQPALNSGVWQHYDPGSPGSGTVEAVPDDPTSKSIELAWAVTPAVAPTPTRISGELGDITPAAEVNEPALQALVEAGALDGGSDEFYGGARSSKTAPGLIAIPTVTSSPTPTNTPTGFEPVSGQPRGYAMLYLMQPQARATVERQLEAMLNSHVQEVYLGVLTDGTFGFDLPYLNSVLARLAHADRVITLVLYLSNGATMRSFDSTPIDTVFSQIEPAEFRELIRFDPEMRADFISLTQRVKPIFAYNASLDPLNRNIAVVMLEDNLDFDSYRAMRDLAESVLGAEVEYIRNPCPGCYEGNDVDPQGDGLELHLAADVAQLGSRDGFTLDGTGYHFDDEPPSPAPSATEVKDLAVLAAQRGLRYFGLWRAGRQGLSQGPIHPNLRQYEVPTEAQLVVEIEILRAGLEPLVD